MMDDPATYAWSSAPSHCGHRLDAWLTPHPTYTALAPAPEARAETYRRLLCAKPCPTTTWRPSAPICNSNARWAGTTFVRWSRPRPNASPVSDLPIDRRASNNFWVSEPDPVSRPPFQRTPPSSQFGPLLQERPSPAEDRRRITASAGNKGVATLRDPN